MTESCSGQSSTTETYLGVDVSTSCTGFSLVDKEGKMIRSSFVYLSEFSTIHEKAEAVRKEIEKYRDTGIRRVAIEQNLLGFRRGASSANTLITLARFNGVVHYVTTSVLGLDPITVPVVTARKALGITHAKGEDVKKKVLEWVNAQEPDYVWPQKLLTRGKGKGTMVNEKGVEDAADAYVMARAVRLIELGKLDVTIKRARRNRKSNIPR
jgi:hypothetical protein